MCNLRSWYQRAQSPVRKLLRIDGNLRHKYGVRIAEPGRREVLRVE